MTEDKLKKTLAAYDGPDGFIKVTDKPVGGLTSEQKAMLNRKGNILFNEGKFDAACRIYVTTGYSDGLTRVGDIYMKQNKALTALKYYLLAKNKGKQEMVHEKLAKVISAVIK